MPNALNANIIVVAPSVTGAVVGGTSGVSSGSSLSASTAYFYKVASVICAGPGGPEQFGVAGTVGYFQSAVGAEGTATSGASTPSMTVTIPNVAGATHYLITRGTVTNTEFFLTYIPASNSVGVGSTVFVDTGALSVNSTTSASITNNIIIGNCLLPGGNVGGLYSSAFTALNGAQSLQSPPVPVPFQAGHNVVFINPTGGSITISGSPDGVTATTTYATVPATGQVDTLLAGLGGLPNFIKASAAGVYMLAGP